MSGSPVRVGKHPVQEQPTSSRAAPNPRAAWNAKTATINCVSGSPVVLFGSLSANGISQVEGDFDAGIAEE